MGNPGWQKGALTSGVMCGGWEPWPVTGHLGCGEPMVKPTARLVFAFMRSRAHHGRRALVAVSTERG